MDPLVFPLILLALVLVVVVVGAPLRRGAQAVEAAEASERQGLEAARDAKYREIRELELDFRTGKLDEDEFKRMDRQLRAEAVQILRDLDALH